MNKILVNSVFVSLLLLLFIGKTSAGTNDISTSQVRCTVAPSVTLSVADTPPALHVSSGLLRVRVTFRVDSNVDSLNMVVGVSNLFKAGDPDSEVAPILVDVSSGVTIEPYQGTGATLHYTGKTSINGFPSEQSEAHFFQSSQDGRFSQFLDVEAVWNQDDPARPQGTYIGYVLLRAMVM